LQNFNIVYRYEHLIDKRYGHIDNHNEAASNGRFPVAKATFMLHRTNLGI
jgi:hypothetical protein